MEEHAGQLAATGGKLSVQQVELAVRELDGLPTLPSIAAAVLAMTAPQAEPPATGGEQAALDALARLVACDPPLSAKVLALAAAAEAGHSGSILHAVRTVGPACVRATVLSMKIAPAGLATGTGPDIPFAPQFWRHCLAVAACAAGLVEQGHLPLDPAEAYAAGLLHDLGKLALAEMMPKSYAHAVSAARTHGGHLADYEKRILGVDHLVVGRHLAQRWHLPQAIGEVIWLHHHPGEAIPASVAGAPLIRLVALADAVARQRRIGVSGNSAPAIVPEGSLRALGLTDRHVASVAEGLTEAVERLAVLAGLDRPDAESAYRQAAAGAGQELGRLNEQLRGRQQAESARARAMESFSAFAGDLPAEAEVADVLARAAEAYLAWRDLAGRPAQAVVCYSLDHEDGSMLAVRCRPQSAPAWRTLPLAAGTRDLPAPPRGPADEPIARLLGGLGAWDGWVDLDRYTHQPLTAAGRWVGGVLYPTGEDDETSDALAAGLGTVLSLVQQRCRAEALSEELAGSSQELAEAQEALTQARTLAAVGDLAAGAAHEMNNPLAVVSGRAQLMRDKAQTDEQRRTWQTIADQAQRISDIISDLMDFASPPAPRPAAVAAGQLLAAAAEAFSASNHPQAKTSRVDIETAEHCPAAWADAGQMQSVVVELMTNAATASRTTPHIRLAAAGDELADAVLLTVRDDGPGMDEATVAKAYTPFFSAQQAGRRRGLGLSRAKRYVENNGGKIWIESTPGQGTCVWIQLPAAPGAESTRGPQHDQR